ncbi:MAG: hypothetical protein P8170_05115 [Gemmatimonadota bacterium]
MNRPPLPWSPVAAVVVALALGCGTPEAQPPGSSSADDDRPAEGNFHGRIYERSFVFTTLTGDSAFVVPWLMSARTRPGGVDRSARGWLARGDTWEPFYDEGWETPPSRAPWRILPHRNLRLVVGEADAVVGILFAEGPRELELELSSLRGEWTGGRGQVFRLLDAALYLSDQRIGGVALDISRAFGPDESPHRDWAFLTSGDSLQMILEGTAAPDADTAVFDVWGQLESRDLTWPELTLQQAEVRAFQPARQDVPVSWKVTTADGAPVGDLQVSAAQIRAGDGSGPVLPVDALFLVSGTLTINGREYPVRGLFRHTRP